VKVLCIQEVEEVDYLNDWKVLLFQEKYGIEWELHLCKWKQLDMFAYFIY
jgi:hypothetical protein